MENEKFNDLFQEEHKKHKKTLRKYNKALEIICKLKQQLEYEKDKIKGHEIANKALNGLVERWQSDMKIYINK